jgi:hypothetical protein
MRIKELVIDYLKEQLLVEKKIHPQIFEERVYLQIVDKLPAGELVEEIATAAGKLYDKLLEVESLKVNQPKTKELAIDDYYFLLEFFIKRTFVSTVSYETVFKELEYQRSIDGDEILEAINELHKTDDWE